ncbi:hypothetical protein [Dysgonomonas sp. Marseille-Q5470]|uniref:hypothetical protein n=1 Tax=Dysgonomonas sp. Marseille-Q5470 TaxID=3039494 RepID=UPI0024BC136A|nr:hypothetical protein [Dysgonomonas sp. Marseille-Q5470]
MADCIIINEVKVQLQGEPFDQYIETEKSVIKLSKPYLAGWKLINNTLYLIELFGWVEGKTKAYLSTYFDNEAEVKAYWFTGELMIQLRPYHLKHKPFGIDKDETKYKKEVYIQFTNGNLSQIRLKEYEIDKETFNRSFLCECEISFDELEHEVICHCTVEEQNLSPIIHHFCIEEDELLF